MKAIFITMMLSGCATIPVMQTPPPEMNNVECQVLGHMEEQKIVAIACTDESLKNLDDYIQKSKTWMKTTWELYGPKKKKE